MTLVWAGGATATLQGAAFETADATYMFSNSQGTGAAGGTANFGSATAIPTFS